MDFMIFIIDAAIAFIIVCLIGGLFYKPLALKNIYIYSSLASKTHKEEKDVKKN